MTYCVAMKLEGGLVMASDTRTNAGVDHIATFCKMAVFEHPGQAVIALLSAGNLATTQSTISLLRQRIQGEGEHVFNQRSLYDVACLVGATLREIMDRDSQKVPRQDGVDFGCSFLLGGQIKGEGVRLFNIYPQGNFIEASVETPYFQIGESKYGKPILDRVISYETPLSEASKCVLISFDSTIKSNVSVGLPIDLMLYRADSLVLKEKYRVAESDPYFKEIRQAWSAGLRRTFESIPDPDWA
jgi:putative proteasome-type protease